MRPFYEFSVEVCISHPLVKDLPTLTYWNLFQWFDCIMLKGQLFIKGKVNQTVVHDTKGLAIWQSCHCHFSGLLITNSHFGKNGAFILQYA